MLIALGFGVALGSGVAAPPADFLGRLSIDLLLPLRHYFYGPLFAPNESAVAAIVIDEETYKTPPFSDTPKVAWTPHLAEIISAEQLSVAVCRCPWRTAKSFGAGGL